MTAKRNINISYNYANDQIGRQIYGRIFSSSDLIPFYSNVGISGNLSVSGNFQFLGNFLSSPGLDTRFVLTSSIPTQLDVRYLTTASFSASLSSFGDTRYILTASSAEQRIRSNLILSGNVGISGTFFSPMTHLILSSSAGSKVSVSGNLYVQDSISVGRSGSHSYSIFHLHGTNAALAGPHSVITTTGDVYPVFQQLNWRHDDIEFKFDHYYDGTERSSDAGSNFLMIKLNDALNFWHSASVTPGNAITNWQTLLILSSSSRIGIMTQPNVSTDTLQLAGTAGKTAGGTAWASISDQKYKTNVVTLSNSLGHISKLRGVQFNWIDNREPGTQYGVIAQEVEKVVPEWVKLSPNGDRWFNPIGFEGFAIEAFKEVLNRLELLESGSV